MIVLGTGAVATAAFAAGPVVYSEYAPGGDRTNRLAREDGTDVALPEDVMGAAVSPDGRRIAQTTLVTPEADEDPGPFRSTLRVTAGDGTGPATLLDEGGRTDGSRLRLVSGTPVWSPDGRQVLVLRTTLAGGGPGRTERVVCDVDRRRCRGAGTVPRTGDDIDGVFRNDVVTWSAGGGPIVATQPPERPVRAPGAVRCGAGALVVKGPTIAVRGLAGSAFGPPVTLRVVTSDGSDTDQLVEGSAGALATTDGVLVHDVPAATIRRGRLACGRRSGTLVRERHVVGVPRLRLRSGGATRTLPTPPGLRRGDGLRLVGTDDGGAVLLTTRSPGRTDRRYCDSRVSRRVRLCESDYAFREDQPRRTTLRVWRYVPGPAPRFERVTTARRSALRALALASEFAVASGDAVLAVSEGAIERVPLDGGAPTTIARGRGVSLDLGAW